MWMWSFYKSFIREQITQELLVEIILPHPHKGTEEEGGRGRRKPTAQGVDRLGPALLLDEVTRWCPCLGLFPLLGGKSRVIETFRKQKGGQGGA